MNGQVLQPVLASPYACRVDASGPDRSEALASEHPDARLIRALVQMLDPYLTPQETESILTRHGGCGSTGD